MSDDLTEMTLEQIDSDVYLNEGVWFKSAITGCFYRDPLAAYDIENVVVNGEWFSKDKLA